MTPFVPKPPVAPPGPHYSPPPLHHPPTGGLPVPPPGVTGSGTSGLGYHVGEPGKRHKIVYRVGTTATGVPPLNEGDAAALRQFIEGLIAAEAAKGDGAHGGPPPPSSTTITALHVPVAIP